MIPSAAPPDITDINPYHNGHNGAATADDAPLDAAPVVRSEHRESLLTRMIEQQSAKVPSNTFLFLSLCAMAVSVGAELRGRDRASRFVGMWVGPLLTMGVYNKMVKMFGAR